MIPKRREPLWDGRPYTTEQWQEARELFKRDFDDGLLGGVSVYWEEQTHSMVSHYMDIVRKPAIGSPEWMDSAERSEWAFMAKMLKEAMDSLPNKHSGLGVAFDIATARAKEGWRTDWDTNHCLECDTPYCMGDCQPKLSPLGKIVQSFSDFLFKCKE